ncbi:hypothetical protein SPONN_92 [uncultured Candidatus Thioglobus sp.]|nr:hypothetical protein SPONN_92 [uncultured Candidatus Thioglobus sp.]
MKNFNTKIQLAAFATSAILLQGCAGDVARVTVKEVLTAIGTSMAVDEIRSRQSASDLRKTGSSFNSQNFIYVNFTLPASSINTANTLGELQSKRICQGFRDKLKKLELNKQYLCSIIANENSKEALPNTTYGILKKNRTYLQIVEPKGFVNFGKHYQLTRKETTNNTVIETLKTPKLSRDGSVNYVVEYLIRLTQNANE